jgi:hypothetical protein
MVGLIDSTAEIRHVDQLHLTAMGRDEQRFRFPGYVCRGNVK